MSGELILIIDDAKQSVAFITDYVLKPHNYRFLVAYNGEDGLRLALEQTPDLILLDMSLPRMTGVEVLDALRTREIKTPVIVMTFHGSETLAVQAFRMGAKDYILKPFTDSEMIEAMERALAEMRLRQERDDLTQRLLASNQELEKRIRELNTLFGIGKSVTSLLDHDKLLARLVEAAIYLTGAEAGSLLLVDQETNELYMVAARGIDDRVVRSFRLKVEDSLAGRVMTTGQPLILTGRDITKVKTSYLVRSLMYVPLKVRGRISGVLTVDNRHLERDFTNHDLRLLSTLADYAAVSLENVRLFKEVEGERAKLATILTEIQEPVIVITGESHQVLMASAAFCRTFGLDDFLEGQPITHLLHNTDLLQLLEAAPDAQESHKGEISLQDGRTLYATLTTIPEIGQAIIMQDITHLKALDRMKSDFVSTVSHDLRTPLISIKDYVQMLDRAGDLNERQRLFRSRITQGVDHLVTLIDNLLDLSSIEMDMDHALVPVNLSDLAAQVITEFQDQATRKRQKLICHSNGQHALVIGSEVRLKQVLNHLIDNAVKYTPEAGQISTLVQVDHNQVLCKVEDNGPGISPGDLPFVFDKFFRVPHENTAETTGAGLGLSICKSVIEKYQGHIWAESQPGQGSRFTFTLPLVSSLPPKHNSSLKEELWPS